MINSFISSKIRLVAFFNFYFISNRIFEDSPPIGQPELLSVYKPEGPVVKNDVVPPGKENRMPKHNVHNESSVNSRQPLTLSSQAPVPKINTKQGTRTQPTAEPRRPISVVPQGTNPDTNASSTQMAADRDFENDLKDLEEVIREDLGGRKRSAVPVDPVSYRRIKKILIDKTLNFIKMTRGVKFESSNKIIRLSNPQDNRLCAVNHYPDSNGTPQPQRPVQRNPAIFNPRLGIRAHHGQIASQPVAMQQSVSYPRQVPVPERQNPISLGPQNEEHKVAWINSGSEGVRHQPQLQNIPYYFPNLHHQYQNPAYQYMIPPNVNYPNTVFSAENPMGDSRMPYRKYWYY